MYLCVHMLSQFQDQRTVSGLKQKLVPSYACTHLSFRVCFCCCVFVTSFGCYLTPLIFDSEPEWTKRGLNLQVRAVGNRGSRHGGDPGLRWPSAGVVRETRAIQEPGKNSQVCRCVPNSKHWFTTSFLQALPYLVMS